MLKKIVFILILPCLLLFSLGLWQLFRLYWKSNIIKNMNLPVVHLLPNDDLTKFNYRHIKIDGILSNVDLYVFAGQRGYYMLSPMLLTTGHYMLVNKGLIKERKREGTKIEKVTVSGVLYCDSSKSKSWLIKNDTILNVWFTLSTEEISDELGIKLEKCVLWQKGFSDKSTIQPIKHLEYAITWFVLFLIWLTICIAYYRQNKFHTSS
ncbi:SURF1 family protein [Wolbachia endosymbiont of Dirofilaria (Dirofilaria) immitis]|uniref:SURF1 family protein n=1 Tax=Wolbachia endosymbiont of Dirofilaria (Dirofilaria) immitis TaxID=1812115 RepID=UPI001589BD96|nr:SURF1 family protein [Wolbachia endosymbiont of Dirofilaria (Dirofilaria) immitis]QKX02057.1 SURF1 family protein [Wolbachia endosymbiont of Dirofilaria (Dirofilaria) immitis]